MFVEVAVDFSDRDRLRTYTYAIPEGVTVQPGDLLWVPFGYRPIQGIAISVSETCDTDNVREIDSVVDDGPFISQHLLRTAVWIADYYRTNIFRACVPMLPPGANQQLHIWVSRSELAERVDQLLTGFSISADQHAVLNELPTQGQIRRDRLVRRIGRSRERHLDALVRNGIAVEESIWERPRVRATYRTYITLPEYGKQSKLIAETYDRRRAYRRAELIRYLANKARPVSRAELTREFGNQIVKAVIDEKAVQLIQKREERDQPTNYIAQDAIPLDLTPEQKVAVDAITESIREIPTLETVNSTSNEAASNKFLLFGVTGSGKTEVYLRAVEACIAIGRRAIIMVPEIAMTPQTLQRFADRFPDQVVLQHSGITHRQRFDGWHQIKTGRCKVVIGSRASIFAPVDDLGLVVIDEEHERTFKQNDVAPRYHARDVAERVCKETGATLILGSATPDLGSFYRSQKVDDSNELTRLELPRRVNEVIRLSTHRSQSSNNETQSSPVVTPRHQIVDMREEFRAGHREMFSRRLIDALEANVNNGEKSILLINQRGLSSFVQCIDCGTIRMCPSCHTTLTLHRSTKFGSNQRLRCHYCNYSVGASRQCRNCNGMGVARRGAGTQGVEDYLRGLFPNTPILRWDSDTARSATDHTGLLEEFQQTGNQILVGTQMVAKGLDIPAVTLVGAVAADIGLAFPSFRSTERTFQIISQVVGRAGRADKPGLSIIQTFQPDHFAIAAAAAQDYVGFYEQEIATRHYFDLPPFSSYVRLSYSAFDSNDAEMEARSVRTRCNQILDGQTDFNVDVAGPSPALPARRAGRYRWQILLKGDQPAAILDQVPLGPGWTIDVDPIEMN